MMDQAFDALIVGGGHAGLSAALTLYRQQHTSLIFDTHKPRNAWSTSTHILAGWEGAQAEALRSESRLELLQTGLVTFRDCEAQSVEKTGFGFEVIDAEGQRWKGKKLLLAMGKRNVFPGIPGYAANYPDKIFHCMFTFGYEHRGSARAGLLAREALGNPMHAAMVINDTLKFAEEVTVYTDHNPTLAKDIEGRIQGTRARIDDRKILGLRRQGNEMIVELEDRSQKESFLVHQPDTQVDMKLVQQLGLELDTRGDIFNRPPFFHTNVPGVFAAGDCASPFKIIPTSLFMGANAGAGIARELPAKGPEEQARDVSGNGATKRVVVEAQTEDRAQPKHPRTQIAVN